MNHIMVAGHLGADPESRVTPSGQKVTTLRVAANQRRGGKEETIWWKITLWGDQFDKVLSYFKKGSSIIVYGEMSKPEIYTDREGNPQVSLNVTASQISFSPFGRTDKPQEGGAPMNQPQKQMAGVPFGQNDPMMQQSATQGMPSQSFTDDEIPF
ncbi:MAG: single-stranded DNA-binding protein [Simkaniaceae bacterium]|nr:single-stranded DNA-binding protein [Simkaniaceae bacterium]